MKPLLVATRIRQERKTQECWWYWEKWHFRVAIAFSISYALASSDGTAFAQILPDTTLGNENSTVTSISSTVDQINGGAPRGANLFHSFLEFNVDNGRTVSFTNAPGIENILTRVTGTNASNILGTLAVSGGNANLFLINPNGIIFGQNARLDLGGSFVATTANAIEFDTQGFFNASAPNVPPLLTVNPSAFFFNQITPGKIENQSFAPSGRVSTGGAVSGLLVPDGRSLLFLGGDIVMNGGKVGAPGGRIELVAVAGAGTVKLTVDGNNLSLSVPDEILRANVLLNNQARVSVISGSGGNIVITARKIDILEQSLVSAGINSGLGIFNAQGGDITLNATETVRITGSTIRSRLEPTRVVSQSSTVGQSGNINIATGSLFLADGAQLTVSTFGQGNAGNVNINARETVSFDGKDSRGLQGGVFSIVQSSGVGKGGNINITARSVAVTNGALLSANTFGQGDGGNVIINANTLSAINGGQVLTSSRSSGKAGNIIVNVAQSVTLAGSDPTYNKGDRGFIDANPVSGLFANTLETSTNRGGELTVNTRHLIIRDGAQATVSSRGTGDAGTLTVNADSILLDSRGKITGETASGRGGDIQLQVRDYILMRNESAIATSAQNNGSGGNITINSPFIVALPKENSDIIADAQLGSGGQIRITATGIYGLEFRDKLTPLSDINASSEFGVDGTVELNTPEFDPSQSVTNLPENLVDSSELIANSCIGRGSSEQENSFVITGTGGLPPRPGDAFTSPYPTGTVRTIPNTSVSSDVPSHSVEVNKPVLVQQFSDQSNTALVTQREDNLWVPEENVSSTTSGSTTPTPLVEASGWVYGANGEIILTSVAPAITPHSSWSTLPKCQ